MTQILSQNQCTLNLESTQQALNQLRTLRQKRKRQNPSSIYDLVKNIYLHIKQPIAPKNTSLDTINAKEYLGPSRDSIEQMLLFIKAKICDDTELPAKDNNLGHINQVNECSRKLSNQAKISPIKELQQPHIQVVSILKQKQAQIKKLSQQIKYLEQANKSMQIKLLNNVKRLTLQIQQKDLQLKEVKKILEQKEQEIEEMCVLNEKKYKKMRKLEEDIYDLRLELAQKNDELEAERDCADFLEKKVDKLMSFPSQSHFLNTTLELKTAQSNTQASQQLCTSQL